MNRKLLIIGFLLIAVLLFFGFLFIKSKETKNLENLPKKSIPKGTTYVQDQIIVKYKDGVNPLDLEKKLKEIGVISQEKLYKDTNDSVLKRYFIFKLKKGVSVEKIYEILNSFKEVENAEPNYIIHVQETPNDPNFQTQWGLKKIHAEDAWNISKGSKDVVVAVIDTGIDYKHEDLPADIIKGRNFAYGNDDPMDDMWHGTHVSGTIGELTNNGKGGSGANWDARLMAIKACDANGACQGSAFIQGIRYAADNNAKVINMSLAGTPSCSASQAVQDAINYALEKKVVIVVAAGNDGQDASNYNPASCNGVVTVGATDNQDKRSIWSSTGSSNWGNRVDIAAPGTGILSTSPGGYRTASGTSMASPHVAGAAALLLSKCSNLAPREVRDFLVNNGDSISTDLPIGGRRLNIFNALNACSGGSTPTPTSSVSPTGSIVPTPTPTPTPSTPPNVLSFSIIGRVYTKNRVGVPGKTIFFHRMDSFPGLSGSEVSNNDGDYFLQDLEKGSYKLGLMLNNKTYIYPNNMVILNEITPVVQVDFILGDDEDTLPDIQIINPIPSVKPVQGVKPTAQPKETSIPSQASRTTPVPTSPGKITGTPATKYRCVPDQSCVNKNGGKINLCPLRCSPI